MSDDSATRRVVESSSDDIRTKLTSNHDRHHDYNESQTQNLNGVIEKIEFRSTTTTVNHNDNNNKTFF